MITLISPAKNLNFDDVDSSLDFTRPSFLKETELLIKKLKKLKPADFEKMMKISPALAQLNYERYQMFEFPFPEGNKKHAAYAFNGEVYNGLSAVTFNKQNVGFAQDHLRILSGLYGVLKPLDEVLPYRLEMGTKFEITKVKSTLYKFWGTKISDVLNEELKNHSEKTIVNLASTEYFKAVDKNALKANIVTPLFKDRKGDDYKVIMMYAKKARGLMARFVIDNEINSAESLKSFSSEGYLYNENISTETDWVFTRG